MESLDLSGFDYQEDTGVFQRTVSIPEDAPEGGYTTVTRLENRYGVTNEGSSGFSVDSRDATFSLSEDIETEFQHLGEFRRNITVQNRKDSELSLGYVVDGLNDSATVNEGSNFTVEGGEEFEAELEVFISSFESLTGDVMFIDQEAGYNRSVSVDLDFPSCENPSGPLCLSESSFELEADSRDPIIRSFTAEYQGMADSSQGTVTVEGNISRDVDVTDGSVDLNRSSEVEINVTASREGYFEGNISVTEDVNDSTAKIPVSLDSTVSAPEPSINLDTSSIELGEVGPGDTVEREILVENNGTVDISAISADSDQFNVQLDSLVGPDASDSTTYTLSFSNVETGTGEVVLTASSGSSEVSRTLDVSASVGSDYEQRISRLEDRIDSLQSRASSSSITSRLENQRVALRNVESLYSQGETERADSEYQRIESSLDSIESRIESGTGTDPAEPRNESTERPGTEPGAGTGAPNSTDGGSDQQSGGDDGGISILIPIAVFVLVMLVAGFVFITSYVPEEGDPLYDLLGEG
jgi:hypothetical protein